MSGERIAYLNARLLDPASGMDAPGALLVQDGRIADVGPDLFRSGAPSVGEVVDCKGLCLAPGLVDMRVQLREPGEEHKETIHTAGDAAAAGGVTTMVSLPNTNPVIDDVSVVEFIARRAQEARRVNVRCYGSVTRGLRGEELTEMGLLSEAGALGFTDGTKAVALFNRGLQAATVTARWTDIGVTGQQLVRDLWQQRDLGTFADQFSAKVPAHGAMLLKVGRPR